MNESGSHPGEKAILALLDGELSPEEAEEVRGHCASCMRCRRLLDDDLAVRETLRSQPAAEPLRPVWPVVEEHLERDDRPLLRPVFGLAAAAAILVGIFLGLQLGSTETRSPGTEGAYLWSVVGSDLVEDGVETLAGAYVSTPSREGRSVR